MQITGLTPQSFPDDTHLLDELPYKFKLKDPYKDESKLEKVISTTQLVSEKILTKTDEPLAKTISPETRLQSFKQASEELFKSIDIGDAKKVKELIDSDPQLLQSSSNISPSGESAFLYSLKKGETSIAWTLFHSIKNTPALLMDRGVKNRNDIPFTEAMKGLPPCPLDLTHTLHLAGLTKAIFDSIKTSPELLFDSLSSIEYASCPGITFDHYLQAIKELSESCFPGLSSILKLLLIRLSGKERIGPALDIYSKCNIFISNKELWELLIEVAKIGIHTSPLLNLINTTISYRNAFHDLDGQYFYLLLKAHSIDSCISFIKLSKNPSKLQEEIRIHFIDKNKNTSGLIDLIVWKQLLQSHEGCKIIAPYILLCLKPTPELLLLQEPDGTTVFHLNNRSSMKIKGIIELY